MDALIARTLPVGPEWLYEPKWDGFRCLAFRDGREVYLQSKSGQPLARYFPEVVDNLRRLPGSRFVLDGELLVPVGQVWSFERLQMRLHPAESRVRKLSLSDPAVFMAFDVLAGPRGGALLAKPLRERRRLLEEFATKRFIAAPAGIRLSPATIAVKEAERWFAAAAPGQDGVMAKRLDAPYAAGERTAMVKVKRIRTADCVVGGFRYAVNSRIVGSLLLGLHDEQGLLHHVGFTANFPRAGRIALTKRLEGMQHPPGFTGRAPGGPSRWSSERSGEWVPVHPRLVVEVSYDHLGEGRFRHGTSFVRWRIDKPADRCTFAQLDEKLPS
jgi:ATP-dependent DNA ligase